ncbi:MAG: DegV family protein [Agathobacter sp.]|nr:DegV family protein [Agathobacter sp.]
MVKVIADSTCDLSEELIEKYGITIIPLYIVLGEKEYRDKVEIMPADIYKWSDENKTTPKTAALSIDDAVKAMMPILEQGDDIVIFSISKDMSSTNNVFRLATEELEAEDRISVIDSANLSTGIGLMVIEAAIMAQAGKSKDEITAVIEGLKPRVRASFVVDTLEYLHRGGRCSGLAALAGGMLKLHPKIVVKDGAMGADKKYRGKIDAVILKYAKEMEADLLTAKKDRVFITHSGCDDEVVASVKEYLESLGYFDEILTTVAGGVISSHCGPGTLGVLYIAGE